jgi:hypothetical protein
MNRIAQATIYGLALSMSQAGAEGLSEGGCVWCLTRGQGYTVKMALDGLHLTECPVLSIALLSKPTACVRCGDDGHTCFMCGAGGQPKVPCDPVTGEPLHPEDA